MAKFIEDGRLQLRAKLIRAGWVEAYDAHWSSRSLERNCLAVGVADQRNSTMMVAV